MKRSHFAVTLFVALACSGLQAQTTDMKANIPFDFQLGKTLMPAGEYRIQDSNGVFLLREQGGSHAACYFLTIPTSRADTPATGVLQFNRYGDSYFLAKIWSSNSRDGHALPEISREEKELASRIGSAHTAEVSLLRK